MKRLHVHVAVDDLFQSTRFYSTLFAAEDEAELVEVHDRLARAERPIVEGKATTCCYAKSDKQWGADPQGVPWASFLTYGEAPVYGEGSLAKLREVSGCASGCEPPLADLTPKPTAKACCAPSCCAG